LDAAVLRVGPIVAHLCLGIDDTLVSLISRAAQSICLLWFRALWRRADIKEVAMESEPINRISTSVSAGDLKLEVVSIPVADVDRSKAFYSKLGWRLDADFPVGNDFRVVQFTPPGSPTSIHFGVGITNADAGSAAGLYLVVADMEAARNALLAAGADVSEIFYRNGPGQPAISGRNPHGQSYSTYAVFKDPDGNTWLLQEITQRLEGRVGTAITYTSARDVEGALRRAAAAHGEHEKITGQHDENWPEWYAEYMAAEHSGAPLPR
jgi:catechol 2,3-dioxygenase-like lactoylglutathione lyase family enzyme